jgi:hypothetical protein
VPALSGRSDLKNVPISARYPVDQPIQELI